MSKVRKVVLLITPSREYTRGLLRGIAKYSRIQGLWALYRPLDYREPKGKERLLPLMKTWNPDGILMREPHKIEDIIAMGVPTISCPYTRERIPGITNIMTDHVSIGKMGAEHLLERGFQRFAYCGFDDWWWSRRRGAVTIKDGRHLLVYNHSTRNAPGTGGKGRAILTMAVTRDGISWEAALVLDYRDDGSRYTYPAVIQTREGLVHVSYTWHRKRIKHVVIDPNRLETYPIVNGQWPKDKIPWIESEE